ncbi:unnamed protein product [Echinostoma caproni]|uniref:Uncharacterized protein n=1 Tax=Echinostoma caproni TaxID=27848 RepID=A0A183A827_9TREM|nr:unnamed protein product [Echinostoma caproni]
MASADNSNTPRTNHQYRSRSSGDRDRRHSWDRRMDCWDSPDHGHSGRNMMSDLITAHLRHVECSLIQTKSGPSASSSK